MKMIGVATAYQEAGFAFEKAGWARQRDRSILIDMA